MVDDFLFIYMYGRVFMTHRPVDRCNSYLYCGPCCTTAEQVVGIVACVFLLAVVQTARVVLYVKYVLRSIDAAGSAVGISRHLCPQSICTQSITTIRGDKATDSRQSSPSSSAFADPCSQHALAYFARS